MFENNKEVEIKLTDESFVPASIDSGFPHGFESSPTLKITKGYEYVKDFKKFDVKEQLCLIRSKL